MKSKSDYAFIVGCSNAYSFGLIASMNAQNYFKTNADWEIVYEKTWDINHLGRIKNAFPFNVNLISNEDLRKEIWTEFVDKRTNPQYPIDLYWDTPWFLAIKLLREKKYKAVCVLQADSFVFVNLDVYFKIAESGVLIASEFPFSFLDVCDMPFGNDKEIWDRSLCPLFNSIMFYGQQHIDVLHDTIDLQLEDCFKGESTHSVITFNRSIARHCTKNTVLGLDRRLWTCDSIWAETDLNIFEHNNKIFNSSGNQLKAWHCRWWDQGRILGELSVHKNNKDIIYRLEHNYNLVKSFMEKFNNMIPEIKSEIYEKGFVKIP